MTTEKLSYRQVMVGRYMAGMVGLDEGFRELAAEGLILKIETAGAQMRFDGQPRNHYHIRCVRCGAVEDAPIEPDPTLEQLVQKNSSYHIIGHTVQFLGICPGCKGAED